jgi:nitrate/nitrite-specific signal transduction histidine kinase
MHHRAETVQAYSGALRPGSGTFPAGRLARRDRTSWRLRRGVAAASMVALALALVFSGPDHAFLIVAALSIIGILGYTLAAEQQLHTTAQAVARVARHLNPGDDPRGALDAALRELLSLFGARTVLFVARPDGQARLYRRSAAAAEASADLDLSSTHELTYAFPTPGDVWSAARTGAHWDVRTMADGEEPRRATIVVPDAFLAAHPAQSLLAVCAGGTEWSHRLLLLDARTDGGALRMLGGVARQLGPALCNLEALGRISARAGAAERARVARDIHDGIIQALIGLEMQVHVWRRHADPGGDAAAKLGHIQDALRQQVLELRDLIHQIKPASCDPEHILEHLAGVVERFQRDTGISAHFVSTIKDVTMTPRVCNEIARSVEEALVNVRKHSGARHVVVRAGATGLAWTFEVDDDGRGFEFAGRRSQAELDLERKGPVIIKERIHSIGGTLAIESNPGRGARLEISVPRRSLE